MPLTKEQMQTLETNVVSREIIKEVFGDDEYYLNPLIFIEDELGLKLTCSAQEYRFAVEVANDENVTPTDDIRVICDGVLAIVFADILEECGIDLTGYFHYRFNPPQGFREALKPFISIYERGNQNDGEN